jgi:hypothetical protein
MLEKIKKFLKEIKQSKEFIDWKEKNKDAYLASIFYSTDLQGDFYSPENDNLTSFTITNKVNLQEAEIFRKEKKQIKELKLDEVKIDLEKVKEIVSGILKEETTKEIIILQNLNVPLWNITYITKSMNIFNIKINAISGEVIENKTENILNFKVK